MAVFQTSEKGDETQDWIKEIEAKRQKNQDEKRHASASDHSSLAGK